MASTITYQACPVCNSTFISKALTAKDFTVSAENFDIWHCNACTHRFTQQVPDIDTIGPYYQSDAYISHSDNSEGIIHRLYHTVRNYTLQVKRKLVQKSTGQQQGHLLDVGAGTGAFSHAMQQAGWQITALEPDDTARKTALSKYGLQLQNPLDIYQLPSQQFDAITLWHVLEHVHNLQGYMQNFHRLLKPNGKLFIAVPNYTSYDAQHYHSSWAAYDVPRHLYHFSPQSMNTLASLQGFTIKAYKPMWFDSFYVSMLSEKYKNGKENLIAGVWNGLLSNLQTIKNGQRCSSVIYVLAKK